MPLAGIERPLQAAGGGIERESLQFRGGGEQGPVYDDGIAFEFRS